MRLSVAPVQMLVISFITFSGMRLLPGDPAVILAGADATPDTLAQIRNRLGLDEPFFPQYWHYIEKVVQGDLGISIQTSQSVTSDLLRRTPATLELTTIALLVMALTAIPLGIYAASPARTKLGRLAKRGIYGYGLSAGALPEFWLGLLFIYFFFFKLNVLPAPLGRLDPDIAVPESVTGFLTIDSVIAGNWAALKSAVLHLILPVITIAFAHGTVLAKMSRATVGDILDSPYVRFAHASGLPQWKVQRAGALGAAGPIVTLLGVVYGFALGNTVLVETIFSWGGVGQYAAQAVLSADFQAIQGFVLVAVVFNLLVYLTADMIHATIDPRVRL